MPQLQAQPQLKSTIGLFFSGWKSIPKAEQLLAIGFSATFFISLAGASPWLSGALLIGTGVGYVQSKIKQDALVNEYQKILKEYRYGPVFWGDSRLVKITEEVGGADALHNACVLQLNN